MTRRCVYCGAWVKTLGLRPTCHAHSDLPALDPWYRAEVVKGCAAK